MESSMEETSKDLLQEDKFCKISWIEYQKKHKLSAKTIRDYQKKRQLKAKRK